MLSSMRRRLVAAAGIAAALALAGCAGKALVSATSPAPKASAEVEARARAFESFTRKAQAIDPQFSGPSAVARALEVGAGYEPQQLEAGVIAFAALAALQEPRFVAGVRAAAKGKTGRRDLIQRISARPEAALELAGGKLAAGRANAALLRQVGPMIETGRAVKKASYTIQRQAWAKGDTADPAGRLSRVKQISRAGYRPGEGDGARLQRALADGGRKGSGASPAVARGLAAAAMVALGEPGRANALMKEPKSGMCIRVAKLNLYQCLASAKPYYEDVYCLAAHAMIEPGECVTAAAEPKRKLAMN